jgi:hypothetical protein
MTFDSHERMAAAAVGNNDRMLIAASLWLRLGFVGLLACVGAVVALARGWPHALGAIAVIAAGSWLVSFSWRRVNATLGLIDEPGPDTPATWHRDSAAAALVAGRDWSARRLPDSGAAP